MRLFKWLRHSLRRLVDKVAKRFYEGPEPPRRLAQAATAFAFFNEHSTTQEWIDFTTQLAEDAYREGYVRGLEHVERQDPDPFAELEDERRHDWSWVDLAPDEQALQRIVDEHADVLERMSPEQRMFYQDRIGREMGGYRVVLLPTKDPKER